MTRLLEIQGLTVDYGGAPAVHDLDLSLDRGEILGLVGQSGSGKSTVALAILGLLPARARITSGRILVQGEDFVALKAAERRKRLGRRVAYVPQEPLTALNPTLKVGRQIDLALAHRFPQQSTADRTRLASEYLERVGVTDPERILGSYPFQISGGQVQRAALSLAFALKPELILADEPTTALDVTVQSEVLDVFKGLAEETGVGVLFVSHNVGVVWGLCHRAAVMSAGTIVETGETRSLIAKPRHPYTRALIGALPSLSPPRTPLPLGEETDA